MSYQNIVFAKLEKRLFSDHRWYMMSEQAQLNFIRFILFAAETYNKIPKNIEAIRLAFKTNQDLETIKATIKEIKTNFPKFKENKHFYYFDEFETKTNYIPKKEIPRKSPGLPKLVTDKDKEEDKDKEKKKTPQTNEDFLTSLKTNLAYTHINLDTELAKMDAWLSAHKGRQKTKRFIINWLNKIEKPFVVVAPAKPVNNIVDKVKQWEKDAAPPDEDCRKKIKDLVHSTTKQMQSK